MVLWNGLVLNCELVLSRFLLSDLADNNSPLFYSSFTSTDGVQLLKTNEAALTFIFFIAWVGLEMSRACGQCTTVPLRGD